LVLVSGIVGGAVGLRYWVQQSRAGIDPKTKCFEKGTKALTAVLIDQSDPLSLIQREDVRNRLLAIRNELAMGERLEIFTVGRPQDELLRPVWAGCNPESGEGKDGWTENPRRIEEWRQKHFIEPSDSAIADALEPRTSGDSPIMEAIQSVAISSFQPLKNGAHKRLVIVSDMLQHTESLSQYRIRDSLDAFRKRPAYQKVATGLGGVSVVILYIRREQAAGIQGRAHMEFWQEFFSQLGARVDRVVSIAG